MRLQIVTKDYGVIRTPQEQFNQDRYDELVTQMEDIGDKISGNKADSLSVVDDRGNFVILSANILSQAVFIVER